MTDDSLSQNTTETDSTASRASALSEFVSRALATPSVQPDRPPEPEPLQAVEGTGIMGDRATTFVAMFEDDPESSDEAVIVADPGVVADLERWE